MSNIITTFQPRALLPVEITPEAFEWILENPALSRMTAQSNFEPQSIYLEIGECRESTLGDTVKYLDKEFPGLLDSAFEDGCEVIQFSK